jgi:hypothetical protein
MSFGFGKRQAAVKELGLGVGTLVIGDGISNRSGYRGGRRDGAIVWSWDE